MSADRNDREEGNEEPSFRVIDRRRFSADGSEREPTEESVAADSVASIAESERPGSRRESPPAPGPELAHPQGEPYDGSREEEVEASFVTLVLSLSTQALMFLGEIPMEPEGVHRQDLAGARHAIDLLGVLEQKTHGNLTEDEAALLTRVLYDLRMRFVQLSSARR